MIPKLVHYCWFGNQAMPDKVLKNIQSWKSSNPDYKFIEWNEQNFDINSSSFVKEAYSEEKWAFVTDYVRLYAVYNYGGFYFDTDVQLVKKLDEVNKVFPSGFMGFQGDNLVASGLGFAAPSKKKIIKEMMDVYNSVEFDEKKLENISCPILNTNVLIAHGLKRNGSIQSIDGLTILPKEFLCPLDLEHGKKEIDDNTIAIHYYNASWMSSYQRTRMHIILNVKRIIPQKLITYLRKMLRRFYSN
ncbi:glycosyltransferase family 32 protein [Limosilactobacillus pontis]|uniref:glycosyltransferase family 32 protein n=1 Tax=Limosilactobacillus pontis TaxID=35787 RepID=UPI00241F6AD5|nr:glycosyltransferase [Limosilactobacillus pontis]